MTGFRGSSAQTQSRDSVPEVVPEMDLVFPTELIYIAQSSGAEVVDRMCCLEIGRFGRGHSAAEAGVLGEKTCRRNAGVEIERAQAPQ